MTNGSLRNKVAEDILRKIRSGEISSDMIMTEASICASLALSRTPVREALIELTLNGVLEKITNKGYKIRELDYKSKSDISILLADLEALAAKLAINNLTEEDYAHMEELIDMIDVAIKHQNYVKYSELQEQFHNVYNQKCDNPMLIEYLYNIKIRIVRYIYYTDDTNKLFDICRNMNDEHREILKLFKEKKADELEDYLVNVHWFTKYSDAL